MIVFVIILILLAGIIIYWVSPYSPYKSAFIQTMEQQMNRSKKANGVCTAEEIARLPELLQRYCSYIGLENFPKYHVVRTIFKNTKFVFHTQSGRIIKMDYDLWLFYDPFFRSAYCKSSMYGIPFDGIDYCTEEKQGGMKGIIGKIIPIFDVRDEQGYKASIISWLAESVAFNPSILLSPYVTFKVIDDLHLEATVTYNGVTGTGIITFDKNGAIIEFYSDERQVENINGVPTLVGWRCEYEDYKQRNGIRQIGTIRCVKMLPDKEVVYFDSDDFSVTYLK